MPGIRASDCEEDQSLWLGFERERKKKRKKREVWSFGLVIKGPIRDEVRISMCFLFPFFLFSYYKPALAILSQAAITLTTPFPFPLFLFFS